MVVNFKEFVYKAWSLIIVCCAKTGSSQNTLLQWQREKALMPAKRPFPWLPKAKNKSVSNPKWKASCWLWFWLTWGRLQRLGRFVEARTSVRDGTRSAPSSGNASALQTRCSSPETAWAAETTANGACSRSSARWRVIPTCTATTVAADVAEAPITTEENARVPSSVWKRWIRLETKGSSNCTLSTIILTVSSEYLRIRREIKRFYECLPSRSFKMYSHQNGSKVKSILGCNYATF